MNNMVSTMTDAEIAEWQDAMEEHGQRAHVICNGDRAPAYARPLPSGYAPAPRVLFSQADLPKYESAAAALGLSQDEAVDALMRLRR